MPPAMPTSPSLNSKGSWSKPLEQCRNRIVQNCEVETNQFHRISPHIGIGWGGSRWSRLREVSNMPTLTRLKAQRVQEGHTPVLGDVFQGGAGDVRALQPGNALEIQGSGG